MAAKSKKTKRYYFIVNYSASDDEHTTEKTRRGTIYAFSASDAGEVTEDMARNEWGVTVRRIEIFKITDQGETSAEPVLIYSQYQHGKVSELKDYIEQNDDDMYDVFGIYTTENEVMKKFAEIFKVPLITIKEY